MAKYQYSYLFDLKDWQALGYHVAPATGSPAMDRGTEVHQTCEDFVQGKIERSGLHKAISPAWANLVADLKRNHAVAEEQWAFDDGWNPTPDNGAAMWLRMKIDVHQFITPKKMRVIDYKTGKFYNANVEQVEVYAIGAFAKFDDVDEIITELWYFDFGEPYDKTFKRSQVPKLARKWEGRANPVLAATSFPPRVTKLCDWCPYNQKKGGPCTAPADALRGRAGTARKGFG
jgi:hypothetical protein